MRIAISGAAGIAALLLPAFAAAQGERPPAPPAPSATAPAAPPKPPAPRRKAPANPDAPPAPPPPGLAPPPPAPAQGPVFPSDASSAVKDPPLAGWHGSFYLRDPGDYFRLYPRGRVHLDFNSWPGALTGDASEGGVLLQPRFFVKSLRMELAGQFFQRWTFLFSADFGGQPISNSDGGSGQSPAGPGSDATARYAPVEAIGPSAILADAYINYSVCPCLNFMIGQFDSAFSMENQTSRNVITFIERSLGVTFAVPWKKDTGLLIWGEVLDGRLAYGLEVSTGDGTNRPQIDSSADFMGRIFTRPLLGSKNALEKLQIGVSARTGQRDPKFVGYDYSPITTAQGYQLWSPTYRDSVGRLVHVIPSGSQNAIGGELRVPLWIFDLRGEGYYVVNDTREAVDGYQLSNTERLGQLSGVGWSAELSAWVAGDSFINGDPGLLRPTTVSFITELGRPKRGLQLIAKVGGVSADYKGNSRRGPADANTAGASTGSKIDVLEYGFGFNFWYTRNLRLALNYTMYHAPGSGSPKNRAAVPENVVVNPETNKTDPEQHLLHELGARAAIWF
jgi:hypothetical protein